MEDELQIVVNKKEAVLERLNKRNKDRQNYLETKLELRSKEQTEIEGADYFANAFSERAKQIEKNINNLQPDGSDLSRAFAIINTEIQELQKYLSNSAMFLPDYNVKACQNILNELTGRSEDLRQKLMPKKKFGFHGKKISLTTAQKNGVDKVDFSEKSLLPSTFSWTVSNRKNEYIILAGSEVDRKDITISDLSNCFLEIRGHAGSLQISKVNNCTILCGPISRSLFAEFCNNCTFSAACQQLRLHSSVNCNLWIHVTCRAIIEDCTKIDVGNYNYEYSGIDIDFKKSGLDENVNNYRDVADFNWLSPDKPSPNWKLVNEDDSKMTDWLNIAEKFKLSRTP